jgi:glucoamylase
MPTGKVLRVELSTPAVIHWSTDGWQSDTEARTRDSGLGVHAADLQTEKLSAGSTVRIRLAAAENGSPDGAGREFCLVVEAEEAAA